MKKILYYVILENPHISDEQKEKEKQYKKYVDDHIAHVYRAWQIMKNNPDIVKFFNNNFEDTNYSIGLELRIASHDLGKYGPCEWEGYRKYYFPTKDEDMEEAKKEYEKAWRHHRLNNPHHWEYWTFNEVPDNMPLGFVVEMVCDWIGMGMDREGKVALNWYESNSSIILGKKQKEFTETLLHMYYDK